MLATVQADFSIGRNKNRPRIWLDGRRLLAAGFGGGTIYRCIVHPPQEDRPGRIVCAIPTPEELHEREPFAGPPGSTIRMRKVTGRVDGKPVIDLLGRDVELAFPDKRMVTVTFAPGLLTITATH